MSANASKTEELQNSKVDVVDLSVIDCFSTLFAEWCMQGADLIVHLFPRNGPSDEWSTGQYINRCRNCHSEVKPISQTSPGPCPRCGKRGLMYIPGRGEEKSTNPFPSDLRGHIEEAIHSVWLGDVSIDYVPELGAYAVKFFDCGLDINMVDSFCERVDVALEGYPLEN